MTYRTLDEWLDEIEGYSIRRERMPPDALEWVKVAWDLGAASRDAAEIVTGQLSERQGMTPKLTGGEN